MAGEAHALVVLAATAGTEVAEEISRHWTEGRPDEAFFLDRLAVAVTEHLIHWSSAFLCRAGAPVQETLLPHLSPGCGDWDLSDQHRLAGVLEDGLQRRTIGGIAIGRVKSTAFHSRRARRNPAQSHLDSVGYMPEL